MMPPGISVVVCCYNSSERLYPTLDCLVKQTGIEFSLWEVLIIDNASNDNTGEVAKKIWDSLPGEKPVFKVINELVPGLSSARKRGVKESAFGYVLFCDDDNWLNENYLATSLQIMQSNDRIGVLGGTGSPVFEKEQPPYFWENQYSALAVGPQASIIGDITDIRPVVYGAGMVVNKAAFDALFTDYQFEFLLSDRIGKQLISSGDQELCMALVKTGYRVYSSDKLTFRHYIPMVRTTIPYYKKLYFGFGLSYALLWVYGIKKNEINSFKNDYRYICLRSIKIICISVFKLFFKGYYFGINKYKHLHLIHQLYNNAGMVKSFMSEKNRFRNKYFNMPFFIKTQLIVKNS